MRKWVPRGGTADDLTGGCDTVYQVVVPAGWRQYMLGLAHEHLWSGHLGITKTYNRVLEHFFWPAIKADVTCYCKTCGTCQIVGTPNQVMPPAPLHSIPAVDEPFEHVMLLWIVLVPCLGLSQGINFC